MNENVTRFYETVSADEELQKGLQAVVDGVELDGVSEDDARAAMAEAVAAFAAEHDLELTKEDILATELEAPEGELADAELEAVAGGGGCGCFIVGAAKGCGCFMVGGANSRVDQSKTICPLIYGE